MSHGIYFTQKIISILGFICGLFLSQSLYATEFTVDSILDLHDAIPGDGICQSPAPELKCTLRAALEEANKLPDADVINLPSGEYIQESPLGIQRFRISNSLEIIGADPITTIVNANAVGNVFYITQAETTSTVTISNILMKNAADGAVQAFGISNLNLNNVVVTGNSSSDRGIYILPPTSGNSSVIISNSIIEKNNPRVDSTNPNATIGGGGIVFLSQTPMASLTIKDSTIRNNSSSLGGGIRLAGGIITILNSTVNNNLATSAGGGIYIGANVTLAIVNSTISGNSTFGSGGGIDSLAAQNISLFNTTITNNSADADVDGSGWGGGINIGIANTAVLTAINSIIAGNVDFNPGSLNAPDCAVRFSINPSSVLQLNLIGHNILGDRTNCNIIDGIGNVIGTSTNVIDPGLDILADNGGATKTHALKSGSLAIDAGNSNGCMDEGGVNPLATDQRGFDRHSDGGIGSSRCDIGAYEVRDTSPVAVAGLDQEVLIDSVVTLDGSVSQAINGISQYSWIELPTTTVILNDSTIAKPVFTAPSVAGVLTFQLTITDSIGLQDVSKVQVTVKETTGTPPSEQPASNPATSSSSGGCSFNKTSKFDPLFILFLILAVLQLSRSKLNKTLDHDRKL
ncbi:MAG: choice-of-anchor Q domain-containing protein [Gammaproteobacteria bacterium]